MFCYDIGRPDTFRDIESKWVLEADHFTNHSSGLLKFLIGKFSDLDRNIFHVSCYCSGLKSDLRYKKKTESEKGTSMLQIPPTAHEDFNETTEPPPPLVTEAEAQELSSRLQFNFCGECSAKSGENVQDIFHRAALIGSVRKDMNRDSFCSKCCIL